VILEKVMKALPAKKVPDYHWVVSGPSTFHVCVEIDITGTTVAVELVVNVP